MQKTNRKAAVGLKRLAAALWLAAAVIMTFLVCILLFYRNPWVTHRVSAEQLNRYMLEHLADGRSPYLKADHMDLTFTGYYETDRHDVVRAYCYMGETSDCRILICLPAHDSGQLLESERSQLAVIEDATVSGQVIRSDDIAEQLAHAEHMPLAEYQDYYNVVGMEIHDFHSDQEKMRIYQLMVGVLILAAVATGVILWSEAMVLLEDTDENLDSMEDIK